MLGERNEAYYRREKFLNKDFVKYLNSEISKIKFSNRYIKSRDLLIEDDYPLLKPVKRTDDIDKFDSQEQVAKEKQREETLVKLIKSNPKNIFKLIDDSNDNTTLLWAIIYKSCDNHIEIINYIINKEKLIAFTRFINLFNENELKEVLNKYSSNEFAMKNLNKFTSTVYKFIDGNKYESYYWEKKLFINEFEGDFEYLFNKYLEFAPQNLLNHFAFTKKNKVVLEYEEKILKALIREFNKDKNFKNKLNLWHFNAYLEKLEIIKDNDEFVELEMQLLELMIDSDEVEIPKNIKYYFAKYPDKLAKYLIRSYEYGYMSKICDYRFKILNCSEFAYFRIDLIDLEAINEVTNITEWSDKFLSSLKTNNDQIKEIFIKIIFKMISIYTNIKDNVWPNEEIANLIESLSEGYKTYNFEFTYYFIDSFIYRIGVRRSNDGSDQLFKANTFREYAKHYEFSHPNTYKILIKISDYYKNNAIKDKNFAIFNKI